jgi:hypothetical protein
MSFSLTGSAWSLRSSFEFMIGVSVPAFGIQVPDSRQRPGVLQPSGAFRRPSDTRKRRGTGALQDAHACFHPSRLLMS